MKLFKGGVTSPEGFLASGIRAGIKKSGKKDLCLLYSQVPACAAGAFTTNAFAASPVKISKKHITGKAHQAIIVNAGNANCANGRTGDRDALSMARFTAEAMGLGPKEVLVASTGIIGRYLPIDKIHSGMDELVKGLSRSGGSSFAESIMTTDTVKKEFAVKVSLGGAAVTIGGACKGVGMLYPELVTAPHATMLVFITTDAAITKKMLSLALAEAVTESFNMISVDGDMSTNDSCFIMANGLAGNRIIDNAGGGYKRFLEALKLLTKEMARSLAADGEGATKLVEIEVSGARSSSDARKIARKISTSNLLKCAVNGADPNWGRIAASAGSSGVKFDPKKADIYLGNIKVMTGGASIKDFNEEAAAKLFRKKEVRIKVDLKAGGSSAKAWTCDLSKKYVEINAEYST